MSQQNDALSLTQLNGNNIFMFCDYSEFLQPISEVKGFIPARNQEPFRQRMSYLCPPVLTQNDHVYSQFTDVISRRLLAQPYPSNYQNFNPFCPLCLKFVDSGALFITCLLSNERNYLIHQQCLKKDRAYQMRSVGQMLQNRIRYQQLYPEVKNKFYYGLGSRYFYIELSFCHPINDKCFIKISKKVLLNKNSFTIYFDQHDQNSYYPNIILLPLTDFLINVSIHQMNKKDNRSKLVKYVSLRNCKDRRRMMAVCEQVAMEVQIIQAMEEKQKLTENMNYKYTYPLDLAIPLLRIRQFNIDLPQQFQQSQEEDYFIASKSTIVQQLLNQKQDSSVSTIKTAEQLQYHLNLSDSNSSQGQAQKINLSKLIATNTLVQYVKINSQSRLFQNFLDQCSAEDISIIIQHIQPSIAELIKHQYGNYMIQKLFTVCHPFQRYNILQIISAQLPELIKNKQGTHTIQSFIDRFTLNQQQQLVLMQLRQQYYDLCKNNNSTHFIQKVVKAFPLQLTLPFFQYTVQNLLAFALDKNAMCVIKHMMRKLRQCDGKLQQHEQAIEMIKRQLIFNVTFSVDTLIMDSFGNYVIQFCYQMFDLQRCSGITERILSQFPSYAVGKFSSNVLLKCISTYWTDKRIYVSLKSINNNQIIQLFRNKDGNKILLEMMERLEGIQLWDRFYSIMIRLEPTRFYHDRWGVCLGSRSGQVGSRHLVFPEAKRKQFVRK